MFLNSITSNDERFKSLRFHDGLNIVLAERAGESSQGDSRNSTGKSSLIGIFRFLMGGDLIRGLDVDALKDHSFAASLTLDQDHAARTAQVTRAVDRKSEVTLRGIEDPAESVTEWRDWQESALFGLPENVERPTASQLWGQLARYYFDDPVKQFRNESAWEVASRLGFLLGLAPEILSKSGDLAKLEQQRKALKSLEKEEIFEGFTLNEGALLSALATARDSRDEARARLNSLHLDERYADHQSTANSLSQRIQALNDRILIETRRVSDLKQATAEESETQAKDFGDHVDALYAEIGIDLPELVSKRFSEVAAFHRSVIRNRERYLREQVLASEETRVRLTKERNRLDAERSEILRLLTSSVAMDTLAEAQRSLTQLESEVHSLEKQLENATKANQISNTIRLRRAETVAALQNELAERQRHLERPISRFAKLGAEIYSDRSCSLEIFVSTKGNLIVSPNISGDNSIGIKGVGIFLLDIACLLEALELGRTPPILIHDSHIFDATDDRQVASCLNIGARLAEEHGFQYIVTMNSDKLQSVEREGAFLGDPYIAEPRLTDETEDGGLFGFRF
jgi:uncharacterized protein YydD (DUF2326 family)